MRVLVSLIAAAALGVSIAAQDEARFAARSELVVLHASVVDGRGAFVGGLTADAFQVLEDGRPQRLTFFAEQDTPATIGVLVDASGSMLEIRDRMVAGITTLARQSHPDDEFLPVVFNERVIPVLPAGVRFTSDPETLRDSLSRGLSALGRTAFYDALSDSLRRLSAGSHERRVLVIMSDGGDNASRLSFNDALREVQASNVVIYTVALWDRLALDRNPRVLRRLTTATGGLAFEPDDAGDMDRAFRTIAADIRSRYTLAYEPSGSDADGFRRVTLNVQAPGRSGIKVRTRTGYLAGFASPDVATGSGER